MTRLLILEPLDPMLGVFAEERLERGQQFDHVQATIGMDVPGCFLIKFLLDHPGQFAGDDLGVDRIGDALPSRDSWH